MQKFGKHGRLIEPGKCVHLQEVFLKAERLDHIHIYVKDLEKAKDTFSRLLGTIFSPNMEVEDIQIRSAISPLGVELTESTSPDGVVLRLWNAEGKDELK